MTDLLKAEKMAEAPAPILAGQLDIAGAWQRVMERGGMSGVDGISVQRFSRSASILLRGLQARLAGERYQPLPLRMAELEKKNGGALRLLLVPSVVDRVAQSAVAQWLGGRWNGSFDPSSFAYRPGLGVRDALRSLRELHEQGFRWVLDCDVRAFFDSISHELLLARLERWLGASSPMLRWIRPWVGAAVWDGSEVRRVRRGVPQGSPLSPILANFYLHEFDTKLRLAKVHLVRYADDVLVLARTPFELTEHRAIVEKTLADLHLELSPEKTRTTTFEQCFRFLGAEVQGDVILLPFEKRKSPKQPYFVAPVMPPALLRAWQAGKLQPSKPLEWAGTRREGPRTNSAPPDKPRLGILQALSGTTPGGALGSLRKRSS